MTFPVDPFAAAIAQELHSRGFVRTAASILLAIADGSTDNLEIGQTRRAYTSFEQQQVCADLIEQNIILPYAAWEACVLQLGDEELIPETKADERVLENRLLVTTAAADGARRLGSFSYRKPIENLLDTVNRLRGMEPPSPGGSSPPPLPRGGGGGTIPTLLAKLPKAVPYARSTGRETGDDALRAGMLRLPHERAPFSKVYPPLTRQSQPQVGRGWQMEKDSEVTDIDDSENRSETNSGFTR